ncbi:MAG: bifunctional oligoribonuclease/PAP phosphatase NrnA [Anaerotruncus sp.]|nr:bifunctional oligoribonuclease/PAP phosphatase NrnA [Anaerotruncus sp.]
MDRCKDVSVQQAAALLQAQNHILILCHQKPDGDTLGSGFALLYALLSLGKTARIECSDGVPQKFAYLHTDYDLTHQPEFEPEYVVAVDIADVQLFGESTARYSDRVGLCIDHHPSNSRYAAHLLLDPKAAGTVEKIEEVIRALGVTIDLRIATCLYTGLTTDTGCFRYSNVTARTHYLAAQLLEAGVDHFPIDKLMFETKTPARLDLERQVLETLEYAFEGRLAFLVITQQMMETAGALEEDTDGIAAIPRQIAGVEVGITLKQKGERSYRVSMRTNQQINASVVCGKLGGGGHARAAGCTIQADLEQAKAMLQNALAPEFARCDAQAGRKGDG